MVVLEKSYVLSHDTDWFFKCDLRVVHCASNCGIITVKYSENLSLCLWQEIVAKMPSVVAYEDIVINEEFVERYIRSGFGRPTEYFSSDIPI